MNSLAQKLFVLALLQGVFIIPLPAMAQDTINEGDGAAKDVPWTELVFKGSKLMTRITVNIQVSATDSMSAPQAEKDGAGPGDCQRRDGDSRDKGRSLMTVQSSFKGGGFSGNQYEEKIWFEKKSGIPDQRVRIDTGDPPSLKNYCWEDKGVRRQKTGPQDAGENKLPPAEWTKQTEHFFEYPREAADCTEILDPLLVFYYLSARDIPAQQTDFDICVFGRRQLHRLTVRQEKAAPLKVSYQTGSASGKTRPKDTITPAVFSISSAPLGTDNGKVEIFSLLGLNKNIRIYMDPQKGLPVKISGKNNRIGDLELNLRAASD